MLWWQQGKKANSLGIPVILNPIGVDISNLRKQGILFLLKNIKISVICGKAKEINFIRILEDNNVYNCSVEMVKGLANK